MAAALVTMSAGEFPARSLQAPESRPCVRVSCICDLIRDEGEDFFRNNIVSGRIFAATLKKIVFKTPTVYINSDVNNHSDNEEFDKQSCLPTCPE